MSEYQINDTGLPHDITINGTDLSEEDKKKLEKQKTNEDIQNYYNKEEKAEEQPDLNQIDDEKAKLEKKAKDIQKYYDNNPGEHMELMYKDIPSTPEDFKTIINKETEKLKKAMAPKLEAIAKELELKKQQMETELDAKQNGEAQNPKPEGIQKLEAEIHRLQAEIVKDIESGNLDGIEAKEQAIKEAETRIQIIKTEENNNKKFIDEDISKFSR